jgi:uroporphyrinogen-III synthase
VTPEALETRLTGRVVALAETRELDLFADMLERRGAKTLRCPLVSIVDSPDTASVEAWLQRCTSGRFHDLILMTGEGLRRLLGFAERAGMRDDFVKSLGRLRRITRGPKPARALRDIGLRPDIAASVPTTDGLIRDLKNQDLKGHVVGVQLYGDEPNDKLMHFLTKAGAAPDAVAPYRYASQADTGKVEDLIKALGKGDVDVIAFTSSPQVQRLFEVAQGCGTEALLKASLRDMTVAAVGPLVAEALASRDVRVDLVPSDSFFLKPLVNEMADRLGPARR